jgi:hypothetical protein
LDVGNGFYFLENVPISLGKPRNKRIPTLLGARSSQCNDETIESLLPRFLTTSEASRATLIDFACSRPSVELVIRIQTSGYINPTVLRLFKSQGFCGSGKKNFQ